ncbi:MAG: hypothetical protein RR984_03880 [Bacilli bacterium]
MKKWNKPQLNELNVEKTQQLNCYYFKPNKEALEFNPDNVTSNCRNCVEVGAQEGMCKYIGHENAFCS